jgi:predicted nucleic acid-binding protein
MTAVFADTFFYLALLNEDDPAHERALAASKAKRTIEQSIRKGIRRLCRRTPGV